MSADFSQRRLKMVVGQVRTTDVTSAPLIDAMLVTPREAFVRPGQADLAYIDEDIRISDGASGGGARFTSGHPASLLVLVWRRRRFTMTPNSSTARRVQLTRAISEIDEMRETGHELMFASR
ncbi:hypothetical protein LB516_16310 [Mesorhizobium sp. CO1-1-7]|uniref:hypothetical protein n=1 Tax=Mesorhizobium sp. CO1-1-7 TaxID=2876632 RepID=UPI001CD18E74|nr:hypothetical protein [Mesorhizobium sp. CO1-1-7]MBZ9746813.1 hypothetical protein [Mesorhizobium sp. CO1-1-7]